MILHHQAMGSTYLLAILFVSYMLISKISLTAGQLCNNSGNFTKNSTYDQNRNNILSSLASNVAANGGLYNATIGQEPNKIYAVAFCGGVFSTESCIKCINDTVQIIISGCPNKKEAFSWNTGTVACTVRYANRSFLGTLEMDPVQPFYNTGDLPWNSAEFNKFWEKLMNQIVTKASKESSRLKFATGEENLANLTFFRQIYAMVQCIPDLSGDNCDKCLRQSVIDYQNCCGGKQGGGVHRPSCFVRWDLYPFYEITADTPLPSPPSAPTTPPQLSTKVYAENRGVTAGTVGIIVVSTIIFFVAIAIFTYVIVKGRKKKPKQNLRSKQEIAGVDNETETVESLQFEFNTIKVSTNNFSIDNKLGEGGFGAVYKGRLPNGQDIAVKRLSTGSGQGEIEFKNEVLLVAKLQHRNLVRLRGFCLEGTERLLIYEFVPNSSLDKFIFDQTKRLLLDWEKRYKIIGGIARGILYLHEDSRWRIIHRDLKASNILLDANMIPKISDFGLARLFEIDQTQGDTSRVVGTFGYMAPEYVRHGHFTVKSDVFSFGVLVLEIISGQKNSSFHNGDETMDLLTYAWKNWKEGIALNLIDPILRAGSSSEIMRCIHIGLLCVQENETNRPTMASVVLMLTSRSLSLAIPSRPAFFLETSTKQDDSDDRSKSNSIKFTVNEASVTELDPR